MTTAEQNVGFEDSADALVDGDRPFVLGTARDVLRNRTFSTIYCGAFASNIGSWMQNAVLMGYAFTLTKSATFVGIIVACQPAPSLFLSAIGGWIADVGDPRRLLIVVSMEQLLFSFGLAAITRTSDPSRTGLVLLVLAIGIGQAIYAPAYSALLPSLVERENLPAAISLNSAQMNGSRVIGPAIGGVLLHAFGVSWVFAFNAVTYVAIVIALSMVHLPPAASYGAPDARGLRQLTVGLRVAKYDRIVRKCLVTIFLFSAFALT